MGTTITVSQYVPIIVKQIWEGTGINTRKFITSGVMENFYFNFNREVVWFSQRKAALHRRQVGSLPQGLAEKNESPPSALTLTATAN